MYIAICEDEQIYSQKISKMIGEIMESVGEAVVTDIFADGAPLLQKIREGTRYDLILLDLQLENSDGMEVAGHIRDCDRNVTLLFVTGMENRAVEGYAVNALDYVVKSNLEERLGPALNRFLKKRKEESLVLDTSEGEIVVISYNDILWVESENRGVKIVTSGQEYYSNTPVGKIAEKLPGLEYIEIHKSVYVRIRSIKRIAGDHVVMENDRQLPLSRRKRKEVMKSVLEAVKGYM